jgi:DNA-directed RNA polymerase specialized sigma24 family protein
MKHRADFELARGAARGEPRDVAALFDDTFDRVYAFVAPRTPGREAAERATERILERVFAELARYDGSRPFSAWVLATVKQELARAPAGRAAGASPPGTRSASARSALDTAG